MFKWKFVNNARLARVYVAIFNLLVLDNLPVDLFSLLCSLSFQARLDASQNESYLTISQLQDEVAQLKAVREEVQKYVRELEQANDDLERAKR